MSSSLIATLKQFLSFPSILVLATYMTFTFGPTHFGDHHALLLLAGGGTPSQRVSPWFCSPSILGTCPPGMPTLAACPHVPASALSSYLCVSVCLYAARHAVCVSKSPVDGAYCSRRFLRTDILAAALTSHLVPFISACIAGAAFFSRLRV